MLSNPLTSFAMCFFPVNFFPRHVRHDCFSVLGISCFRGMMSTSLYFKELTILAHYAFPHIQKMCFSQKCVLFFWRYSL